MVEFSEYLPKFSVDTTVNLIMWGIIFVLFLVILGVFIYYLIVWLRYNKKITILEDVAGSDDLEPVGQDRAMLVGVGGGGLQILYLKKLKKYRGAYGKRMGKNRYYFAIGPDGYWYNVTLGSLKEGLHSVKIRPTNVNMRYQNESLQEIIKSRYDQTTFWQKYGGLLAFVGLIAVLGIMAYLTIDKYLEVANALNDAILSAVKVNEQTARIIGALDQLDATGGLK